LLHECVGDAARKICRCGHVIAAGTVPRLEDVTTGKPRAVGASGSCWQK
jgi:hypothetical protein